jgi:ferredoxin
MENELAEKFRGNEMAQEAAAIAAKCVQCGQCTVNCPTFRILERRLGQSARPRQPDPADARRRATRGRCTGPPRPLPHLPFLRSHVPGRRPFRSHAGHHARTDRADQPPSAARTTAAPRLACGGALPAPLRRPAAGRPGAARRTARDTARQGSGETSGRPLAGTHPSAHHAGLAGLRAAGPGTRHQRRRGPRARPLRHPAGAGRRRLLRRAELPHGGTDEARAFMRATSTPAGRRSKPEPRPSS